MRSEDGSSDAASRMLALVEELEARRYADPEDVASGLPPRTATSALAAAAEAQQAVKDVMVVLVEAALAKGATWAEIAAATGHKTPSSAYWLYGRGKNAASVNEGHEARRKKLRERVAQSRSVTLKESLPGVSAMEAGRILGVDRRTVRARAERGEIKTVTVTTSSGGRPVTRYLLDTGSSA